MKYERFKSILLIILVISSIVLTGNKWFDDELWPEGYNFFSGIKYLFEDDNSSEENIFNPNEEVLRPAKIIINNSGNHMLFTKSSEKFPELYEEIKEILRLGISSEKFEQSSIDEWNDNLQSKSCYFSYPVTYDSGYFSSQLSLTYSGMFESFKEFIVISDLRIPSVMHLYIKNASGSEVQKTKLNFESKNIEYMINLSSTGGSEINYYSFELNFDSADENSVEQAVIIDPDVLISISGKQLPAIYENRRFHNISENEALYNEILSVFKYNTSNIRKYIESDNSIVFVENYSTLKMHTNNLLEYKSVDESKGIKLDSDSVYGCINSCITFVNNVTSCLKLSDGMYYEISSHIKDADSKSFTLTFDYYLNDNMIVISQNDHPISHAVEVTVTNGKITAYKQICKTFTPTGENVYCSSAIEAIDRIPPENADGTNISDISLAYSLDATGSGWIPLWYIEHSSGEKFTIVPSM